MLRLLDRIFILVRSDPFGGISYLKSSCVEARRLSLGEGPFGTHFARVTGVLAPRGYSLTREQLYQLSCLGRALPFPTEEVVEKAKRQFVSDVLEPRDESPEVLARQDVLLNVLKKEEKLSKRLKKRVSLAPRIPTNLAGESACAQFKASEGGRSRLFKSLMPIPPPNPNLPVDPTVVIPGFSSLARKFWAKAPARFSPARVVFVKELGFKVRVVTANDGFLVAKAHDYRSRLYPAVTQMRGCREALGELPTVLKLPGKRRGLVYSADLRRATDTFRFSWLSKLCSFLGIPTNVVFSDMTVRWDDQVKDVFGGAFMGLPLTWTLLELTHYLICIRVDPSGDFFIKGDDLLALWGKKRRRLHKSLCDAVGFEVNIPKSFLGHQYGTFCEGLYRLSDDKSQFTIIPSVSLRGLMAPSGAVYPDLRTTMDQLVRRGVDRHLLWKIVEASHSQFLETAKSFGVSLYLPPEFGGLGLPHPEPATSCGRKMHSLVQGSLDKGTNGPAILKIIEKPNSQATKFVNWRYAMLDFKSGVPDDEVCPHYPDFFAKLYKFASLRDAGDRGVSKVIGHKAYLGRLKRVKTFSCPLPENQKTWDWATVERLSKSLRATPTSVFEAYAHNCQK